jgi:hypothetical protein
MQWLMAVVLLSVGRFGHGANGNGWIVHANNLGSSTHSVSAGSESSLAFTLNLMSLIHLQSLSVFALGLLPYTLPSRENRVQQAAPAELTSKDSDRSQYE